MVHLIFFFCLLAVFFSVMVISSRNPIHSILYLILVFCTVTSVLICLGAEFIAIIFLIVYVGAIAVLFLFVVMMLNIKIVELEENYWKYVPIGIAISSIFIVQLFTMIFHFEIFDLLKICFYNEHNFSVLLVGDEYCIVMNDYFGSYIDYTNEITNTELLGWLIYTYNFPILMVVSFILLVSMIGSIVLVLNQNINIKRQVIFRQVLRKLDDSVLLKN